MLLSHLAGWTYTRVFYLCKMLWYHSFLFKRFEELKLYFDANVHSNVPRWFKENPQLGRWVSRQRVHYKNTLELLWEQFEISKKRDGTCTIEDIHIVPTPHSSNENLINIGKLNKLTSPMMLERFDKLCTVNFKFPQPKNYISRLMNEWTCMEMGKRKA